MSDWQPSSPAAVARRRAALLGRARRYFATEDVLAVDTPALGTGIGSDPNSDALVVTAFSGHEYFLHTSPEFCMKRLLASGYPDIYSICRVYRDGESGPQHLLEFTLIEWYRLGFGLGDIVTDTLRLIAQCLDNPALAETADTYDYRDAFQRFAGVDVLHASPDELADCAGADTRLRGAMSQHRDGWLDLIQATVVAPRFDTDRLTVLQHYPASMAALARLCPGDARFADRFEVFLGKRELANGYVELTDAKEQRRRFAEETQLRDRAGRRSGPPDTFLLQALESGLPECSGVAVGVERLQMVLDQTDNIGDVVTFTAGNPP